jgi:cytochrome c oxidase cbb3-type subunit 3
VNESAAKGSHSGGHQGGRLRDHQFDGIVEYDNDPPGWWMSLLYLTAVWSVFYVVHYHFSTGVVGPDQWRVEMTELAELRASKETGPLSEEAMRQLSRAPERIARGAQLYASANCANCHGADATGGQTGPNLRDRYWAHGSTMTDIVTTISDGRDNNRMPANRKMMSGQDIVNLAIFIVDLNRAGMKTGKTADTTREKDDPITY